MGMPPVRRAFVILLVAAAVVALGSCCSRRTRTRSASGAPSQPSEPGTCRLRVVARRHRAVPRQQLQRPHQRRSDLSRHARRDRRGQPAHHVRELHLRHREAANRFTRRARARRQARRPSATSCVDAVGASSMEEDHVERLRSAGCTSRSSTRRRGTRSRKSTTAPTARSSSSMARSAFTGGAGVADHWLGNARHQGTLARHPGRDARADRAPARSGLLRELHRSRRPEHAGARHRAPPGRRRRRRARGAQLADRRQQRSRSGSICSASRPRARTVDITHAVLRAPTSRRCGRSRMPCDAACKIRILRRRRHHRRDAGEVRVAPRLRAPAEPGRRDLRVPADDDACEGAGRRRRLEHVRLGELRQPLARAERRAERRRRAAAISPDDSSTISLTTCRPRRRISLEEWRQRSLLQKTREWFWVGFGEMF